MDFDVAPLCIEFHYRIPVDMLFVQIVGLIVCMPRQQRPLEVLIPNFLSACCGYALVLSNSPLFMHFDPLGASITVQFAWACMVLSGVGAVCAVLSGAVWAVLEIARVSCISIHLTVWRV